MSEFVYGSQGQCYGHLNMTKHDKAEEEQPMETSPCMPTSSISGIQLRPLHTLLSQSGSIFDMDASVESPLSPSLPSFKMPSQTSSVANFFPNSQKRQKNRPKDSSPVKAIVMKNPLPRTITVPSVVHSNKTAVTKAEHSGTTPTPSTSTTPGTILSRKSRTRRPTAENTGMPFGAMEKYVVREVKHEPAACKGTPPPPPAPVADADDDDVMIVEFDHHRNTTPFNQNIYETPRKSKSGLGVPPCAIIPKASYAPQHPPPMLSKRQTHHELESTPPPEESTEPPVIQNTALVSGTVLSPRRQLSFGSSGDENVTQKTRTRTGTQGSRRMRITSSSIDARIAAYRKRMEVSDVTLEEVGIFFDDNYQDEEDNTKENRNASSEEGDGDSLFRSNNLSPATVSLTNLNKRRGSNESTSSSSVSERKRKSSDFGLPGSLMKVLKKWSFSKLSEPQPLLPFEGLEPNYLAFLIQRYFLKVEVPEVYRPTTVEIEDNFAFFNNGLETVLDNQESQALRLKTVRVLLESFELIHQVYPEVKSSCWPVFVGLLNMSEQGAGRRRNKEDYTLMFMEQIVKLMEVTHQEYLFSTLKLHFPFIAILLQGTSDSRHHQRKNLKKNFQELVKYILSFEEATKQFSILMNVFNLAVKHYCMFESSVNYFCTKNIMVELVWKAICDTPGDQTKLGLSIIKQIKTSGFGKSICKRIITDKLDELKNPDKKFSDAKIDCFLKEIAESRLVLERVRLDYDRGSRSDVDKLKGETQFHRACAEINNRNQISRKARIERSIDNLHSLVNALLNASTGDINATDNNGNTCFHDACQNGRYDAIELLAETCWFPGEEPSRTNLDILAQDANGNTPLHIALSSLKEKLIAKADEELIADKMEVVRRVVAMADFAPKKKQILFEILNNKSESIFNFGVEKDPVSEFIADFLAQNTPSEPSFTVGITLSRETQEKIKSSAPLQSVFAYWEYFSKDT